MKSLVLACMASMLLLTSMAFADNVSFYLTVPEDNDYALPSPDSVLVDVDLNSTTGVATVTFDAENVGPYTTALYSVLFDANGPFTIASVTATGDGAPGSLPADNSAPTSSSLDSLGVFSESLEVHEATQVVFTLDPTDGVSEWTSASSVLAPTTGYGSDYTGIGGFLAASQVQLEDNDTLVTYDGKTDLDIAGNGTVPGPSPAPEPSSVALLLGAGFGCLLLKRRQQAR